MSIDERLTAALMPLGLDIENSVSFSHNYRYFAFSYSTIPNYFSDDEPRFVKALVTVHLFVPLDENITSLKQATCKALFSAGFSFPTTEDASDKDGRHIVFECEDLDPVEVCDGAL